MRDILGIFLALVFLALGAVLLYDGVSTSDVSQSARTIGGAALLTLGFTIMLIALKNWWKWKKLSKDYRDI
jgi:membrane protease YdiL (CAAX protease family)